MRKYLSAAAAIGLSATLGLAVAGTAEAAKGPVYTKQVGCQLLGKRGNLHSTLTIYSQRTTTAHSSVWGQWFYMSALPRHYYTDDTGGKVVKYRYDFWRFSVRWDPEGTNSGAWRRAYSNPAQIGNSTHPLAGDRHLWDTQWSTYKYDTTGKKWVLQPGHPTCEIYVKGKVPPA